MTKTIMKAVGAVAAGRNRKVHMRIASVTIYCDEGSKGSNPALPQKKLPHKLCSSLTDAGLIPRCGWRLPGSSGLR